MTERSFTPAAGRFAPVRLYDPVVALTRERLWRSLVAMHVAPRPEDVVVDVGCGTGSLAVLLNRVEPRATVIGVDPDPEALVVARRKAAAVVVAGGTPGGTPDWRIGMGDDVAAIVGAGTADTVVSSLVLHQCPVPMKRAVLAAMHETLRPGGKLVIADYGEQRTAAMRLAFRFVQLADGKADTQPNADGILPRLIAEAGFENVRESETVATLTGSLSLYVAGRP
ncbi:class I SAM-dependent methyltransferase [Kitasatospora purpeofusca]|uniref:class I SAM-dependent methyltransferase n=1 Tax=Kitasatospora purpeofusca TaxID=67352 RepID=UPI0022531493|nr:class I SAM-dependent methyltransferase [Kitasatospora purpeofusca]MCX4683417.1 class I SAM-dependent methyltransferase [Kitasatospora purpeofusca]